MNNLIHNSGFFQITTKILHTLDDKTQLECRLVCKYLKALVDQPLLWIQKLDIKRGQSKEVHDAWIDLMQRIEEGSFLEQELVECLMKWYGIGKSPAWPKSSLNGITILHISAVCGVKSIVEIIASYIKDPNPTKENGITPIHSASQHGHIDIVIFLASKVDNLNEVICGTGATPIYNASAKGHTDIVKFLASKVENPNKSRNDGVTPITVASLKGHVEIVEFLASKVDNPNEPGNDGVTPIFLASLRGHTDIVKILASKVNNPNAPRYNGWTPIHAAIGNGHVEVVKYLISNVNEPGESLLEFARQFGNSNMVEFLSSII